MIKNIKTWHLFIAPFIIVFLIVSAEKAKFFYNKNLSFEQIAQNTTSIVDLEDKNLEFTKVKRVVDGDTIVLENDERVRYIGVDTPETKHPDKPVQCFGREASQKNKELVEGKYIYLEKDISEKDKYDRLLRYIYIPNPESKNEAIFVNQYLIEKGFGQVITYPPDVKYHNDLLESQKSAQNEKLGLWSKCKF